MNNDAFPALVSTDWLSTELGASDLVVLDGSWHLPAERRDAAAEFAAAHIPGAQFFDLDRHSDASTSLPHMLPAAFDFASQMGAMGIGEKDRIVIYDSKGIYSAPRVWWTFRAMGARKVAVLDGGLPKWQREGRPLASGTAQTRKASLFVSRPDRSLVAGVADVEAALAADAATVIDARSAGRFAGQEPEPRPGLRQGHIPGSRNVPFATVLAADGTLKPPHLLREVFADAAIDLSRPVIASCGSGVTAAILALALAPLGRTDTTIYDGSWAEWGARSDLPLAVGPA